MMALMAAGSGRGDGLAESGEMPFQVKPPCCPTRASSAVARPARLELPSSCSGGRHTCKGVPDLV